MAALALGSPLATTGCYWLLDPEKWQFLEGGAPSCSDGSASQSVERGATIASDDSAMTATAGAIDGAGNALLAGNYAAVTTEFEFAGVYAESPPGAGMFVAGLGSDGNPTFLHGFDATAGDSNSLVKSAAFTPGGEDSPPGWILLGDFESIDLGEPLAAVGGDAYVTKLDLAGKPLWARKLGDVGAQHGGRLAIDKRGDILLTSWGDGSMSAHDPENRCSFEPLENNGFWILRLGSRDGECLWSRTTPLDSVDATHFALAYDRTTDTAAIAFDKGLGGSLYPSIYPQSVLVQTLEASTGAPRWNALFGPGGTDVARDDQTRRTASQVAFGACDGGIVVLGTFEKDLCFLGEVDPTKALPECKISVNNPNFESGGGQQLFLAKLQSDGKLAWLEHFLTNSIQKPGGLGLGPGGQIAITGSVAPDKNGTGLDFGGAPLLGNGENFFAAVLTDTGSGLNHVFSELIQGAPDSRQAAVDALVDSRTGAVLGIGNYESSIIFSNDPGGEKTASYGSFAVQYQP